MKKFLTENKYLILLWIFCLIGLSLFLGHYSNILLDYGREVYYPERILAGKILYKDLFNIYGPFSYMFNALLYKLLGNNLFTLYCSGVICSLLSISGIYLISKKFLSEFLSFSIACFTITIGITTSILHNFTLPYSWAMLYGLVSFLYSLLFVIKFEKEKKPLFLYLSSLLAGISLTNKYEFIVYAFIIFIYIIRTTFIDWKTGVKAFICFLIIPFLTFGTLFVQGLKINDLINSFKLVQNMAKSKTLIYFYQNSGIYFHPKIIFLLFTTFLKSMSAFCLLIFGLFLPAKNKYISYFTVIFSVVISIIITTFTQRLTFLFLPILLLIFAIFSYKKLKADVPLFILVLSSLAVSLKCFWGLIILNYGTYYVSILLIGFFTLLFSYLPQKLQKNAGIYILIVSLYFICFNFSTVKNFSYKINSPKGNISTYSELQKSSTELISFLKQKTNHSDKVVIFPEGMMINFLADRKSDDFINSLLPLYVESLSESKIIEHFTNDKPEYIIFNNQSMKDYGFNNICNDYAFEFCGFVDNNYNLLKIIDNGPKFLVFKKK